MCGAPSSGASRHLLPQGEKGREETLASTTHFTRIASGVSGCTSGCAVAKAGSAIADLVAADKLLGKERYEPWVQLAWLYESQGQDSNAVNAALKVLDRFPKADFSTLYHLAKRYAGERKYDGASRALVEMTHRDAAQLSRLIGAEPDRTAVATSLGYAIEPLANAQPPRAGDAADILAAIVAVQTTDGNLWNNYGLMCREIGRASCRERVFVGV